MTQMLSKSTQIEDYKSTDKMPLSIGKVQRVLLDNVSILGFSPGHVLLILNLSKRWWKAARIPFPSVKTLALEMNVSPRTVRRLVSDLEKWGFLKTNIRFETPSGKNPNRVTRQTSNSFDLGVLIDMLYKLMHHEIDLSSYPGKFVRPGVTNCHPTGDKMSDQKIHEEELQVALNSKNTTPAPKGADISVDVKIETTTLQRDFKKNPTEELNDSVSFDSETLWSLTLKELDAEALLALGRANKPTGYKPKSKSPMRRKPKDERYDEQRERLMASQQRALKKKQTFEEQKDQVKQEHGKAKAEKFEANSLERYWNEKLRLEGDAPPAQWGGKEKGQLKHLVRKKNLDKPTIEKYFDFLFEHRRAFTKKALTIGFALSMYDELAQVQHALTQLTEINKQIKAVKGRPPRELTDQAKNLREMVKAYGIKV